MDLKTIIRYLAENYEINEESKCLLVKKILKLITEGKDKERKQLKG